MASAVCYVGLGCCYAMVLSVVRILKSTSRSYYNSVPTICWNFFHPCQFHKCCHHLAHLLFWRRNEVFSIYEEYCCCEGVKSVVMCGGIYQCRLTLICLHVSPFNSTSW